MKKKRLKTFWLGTPPWIIIASVVILIPIFMVWTLDNIHRQKEATTRLLLETGAALIRSFEAGTRTGMMGMMGGMHGGRFQLQRLLIETAQQPNIVHIIVTDMGGVIRAHSNPEKIGTTHGQDLDLRGMVQSKELGWRQVSNTSGTDIFEVFRRFTPSLRPMQRQNRRMMHLRGPRYTQPGTNEPETEQVIFIGLDMGPIEASRQEDTRHSLIMASILLLIGLGGISSLFLVQAYRSARSSLTRVKAFSDNVVKNMPIGLIALDMDERIVSFNQIAESILQIPGNHAMGNNADNVLPRPFQSLLDRIPLTEATIEKEFECILDSGKIIPLDVSISRLEGDNGTPLGRIILFRDLTEVQSLKNEIERSQRLASVGRLAAGVAHEIRNPLSSIKGFATYFKDRYQEIPEDKKTAEIMVQEVERLNRVISQLLEFAKPVAIQKKSTDIHTLIQHSLKMIDRDARAKEISINKNIPPDLRDVSIDADRMNQVLLNLYLNAIEAMEYGGTLTVEIHQDKESQRIMLVVKDTGHGINKMDLAHIFDPYFTTKQSGTGLGLAIVHKIIESHHGEIRVESEPDKGTRVLIYLPYE